MPPSPASNRMEGEIEPMHDHLMISCVSAESLASWPAGRKDQTRCLDFQDRKSTRLNSSHQIISYAVFCLKKKKNNYTVRQSVLCSRTQVCTLQRSKHIM